jgi:hypothetical protein
MTQDEAEAVALHRGAVIAEAANPRLGAAERGRLVRAAAARPHAHPDGSERRYSRNTVDRWLRAWRSGGLEALRPADRTDAGVMRRHPELVEEAARPRRSGCGLPVLDHHAHQRLATTDQPLAGTDNFIVGRTRPAGIPPSRRTARSPTTRSIRASTSPTTATREPWSMTPSSPPRRPGGHLDERRGRSGPAPRPRGAGHGRGGPRGSPAPPLLYQEAGAKRHTVAAAPSSKPAGVSASPSAPTTRPCRS